jgi:predicted XRE-type DNA-binding protein
MDDTTMTESSGNIFADLDLEDAEELAVKADIAFRIMRLIEAGKLTQKEAGKRMGLAQPEVSNIVCGRLDGFTLDRLLSCLVALGQDVQIVIRSVRPAGERGELTVVGAVS